MSGNDLSVVIGFVLVLVPLLGVDVLSIDDAELRVEIGVEVVVATLAEEELFIFLIGGLDPWDLVIGREIIGVDTEEDKDDDRYGDLELALLTFIRV